MSVLDLCIYQQAIELKICTQICQVWSTRAACCEGEKWFNSAGRATDLGAYAKPKSLEEKNEI